ncbi:major facilitator superfamily domain-containing protein 4A isoform X2 [Alosa sapidissima]|uniref:major facilitator superfamily domain-containing protein 4A isoform X2 n=1 Tax=Alosa sapidissima TaxID=34773 RepID=UPI001C092B1B|nr:major facilitator superfamily domain-containing protein 4A isoform X2 [Alosa sapidissima]
MQFMDSRVWSLFKNNWQYTLTYWSAFFSFGLCVAFLGPTILDLRCQTHSSLQEITWVFFAQQLFLFVGSSIGGFFNKSLRCSLSALAVCTLVISVVFAMIPLCHRVLALAVAMAVAGMAMGIIDTIANFQLVKLYQKDSTIFLQLPVPIAVFVLMYRERLIACGSGARTRLLERDELAMRAQGSSALTTTPSQSSLDNSSLFSCCRYGDLTGQPLGFVGIHVLAGMVLFFSDGIVGAYEGFVYSYAVAEPMSLPHKTAGYLTSVFWAAITAGRLAAIPLSYRFPASRQLTVNQIGIMCTLLMLLMLYTSPAFLFIGTLVLGLFISSVYPSMLAFTEDMLNYRGCATTLLVTSASMGEMFLQLLVGSVMHSQGSYSFMVCGVIFSILGLSSYLLLLYCWRIYSAQSTGDVEKNTKVENADVNGVNH